MREAERRNHKRYQVSEDVFAALGEKFSRVGRVIDISLSGLAFEYVPVDSAESHESCIDIFVTGKRLHLSRVPCRKVYEIPSFEIKPSPATIISMMVKRCGIEFLDLDEEQTTQLNILLRSYVSGYAG